jgi:adenylate kinase
MKVLMLAPPGGGKGTQGVRIAEELGVEHISSGDLLRAAVAAGTPIGREVAEHMAAGRLAPDAVVTEAVRPALDARDGYVLDGFPRNLAQTGELEFDAVIHLDVPEDVTRERLLARGRADDAEAVIEKRLREYAADTKPLIDYYRDRGVLVQVDGDRPPDEITADLLQRLKNA